MTVCAGKPISFWIKIGDSLNGLILTLLCLTQPDMGKGQVNQGADTLIGDLTFSDFTSPKSPVDPGSFAPGPAKGSS